MCELCLAWKESDRTGEPMVRPEPPKTEKPDNASTVRIRSRNIDFVKETLSNLKLIDRHLKTAPVDKVGPLSKRKSELLKELREYQALVNVNAETKPEVDPLDKALEGGSVMANVTRLTA